MRWPDAPNQAAQRGMDGPWAVMASARKRALAMEKSPMEAERTAVQAVLETLKTAPTDDPVFGLLAEAEQAGTLDAAIFALLLDRPLFSEFQAWRNANHMWFVAYISEHLAPIPAAILALPPGVPLSGGAPAPTPAGSVP